MTSPLSTLKKARRPPLPQSPGESERRDHQTSHAEHETSMQRELFLTRQSGSEVTESASTVRSKVTPRSNPQEVSPPTDSELMSSMIKRLTKIEQKVTSQTLDIDKKTRRIAVLEEKLKRLHEKSERQKQDKGDLDRKCHRLQKQVLEMEKFLSDYGMIWVGEGSDDKDEDKAEMQQTSKQPPPGASLIQSFTVNFDLVLQNIRDLNVLAGEGGTCITVVPGGAKLMPPPSGDLHLYKNGMMMLHGPFRPYTEPHTQRFLQELMDGFFPSELEDRFPHGLVFAVDDRREEDFKAEFPGTGHTVGGSRQELTRDRETESNTQNLSRLPDRKFSLQQFLQKHPERVVKEGNVINIHSALKHHLQGGHDAESCVWSEIETAALQALRRSDEVREISSLRVKSEDGKTMMTLKMFFSDTIRDLRRYLDAHRDSGGPPYDIITALPHCRYHSDDDQTLQQCGLTPSAALLLRPRPPVKRNK